MTVPPYVAPEKRDKEGIKTYCGNLIRENKAMGVKRREARVIQTQIKSSSIH